MIPRLLLCALALSAAGGAYGVRLSPPADVHWVGTFTSNGTSADVYALATYNGDVVAGGAFTHAGGVAVNYIARWDGSTWHPFGSGMDFTVTALAVYRGDLIAAGTFEHANGHAIKYIARWDGTTWRPLGSDVTFGVNALAVHDDRLIAGGSPTLQTGASPLNLIGAWDGSTWSDMGGGVDFPVNALAVWDGRLVAGGLFTSAGGVPVNRLALWDGSAWHDVGGGVSGGFPEPVVYALTTRGSSLVVGGEFTHVGGMLQAARVAEWTGAEWKALGKGFDNSVRALATHNGAVVAGGYFKRTGGRYVSRIARLAPDSTRWHSFGGGVSGTRPTIVWSLLSAPGHLYVGGTFSTAGTTPSPYIADWQDDVAAAWRAERATACVWAAPVGGPHLAFSDGAPVESITLFDVRGRRVAELEGSDAGVVRWDAPQRGVYLARLSARGSHAPEWCTFVVAR